MPNLKEVKERMRSVQSTQQITRAMKMVSAAKLRRAQTEVQHQRPYVSELTQMTARLVGSVEETPALAQKRDVQRLSFIAIASDKGLCGGFNSAVAKHTRAYLSQHEKRDITLIPIGLRAGLALRKTPDVRFEDQYLDWFKHMDYARCQALANQLIHAFLTQSLDEVLLVSNRFKSAGLHPLTQMRLLPISLPTPEVTAVHYLYEPNPEALLGSLLPYLVTQRLYGALLESNAAEHGARMLAMDKATDNAQELLRELRIAYNRTRQSVITTELMEIVGGAEALNQ